MVLTLTLILTLIFGFDFDFGLVVGWSVVFANLTLLLFEGVRLAGAERRPSTNPVPERDARFEHLRGIQRRGPRSGGCAGPVRGVRGGCPRYPVSAVIR
jgi:hypothetical protein